MPDNIFGVPAHPLVVHAVVVFVPLAAFAGLIVALWPAARGRFALIALAIATMAGALVPIATESGEMLERRVPANELVEKHAELGDTLLPFVAGLWLGLAVIVGLRWYATRHEETARGTMVRIAGIVAMVAVVLTAIGSGVQITRIGHSGAEAVWGDVPARR